MIARSLLVAAVLAVAGVGGAVSAETIVLTPASAATQKLTPTVGVDIIKMTKNADGSVRCLFQWKDREGNDVQRAVVVNKDTVIGVTGKKLPFEKFDESLMKHKVVATVGKDMETAVLLRFGREMLKISREELTDQQAAALQAVAPVATAASNEALEKKVREIVGALKLNAPEREGRLVGVLTENLKAVRDTHNAGFAPPAGVRAKLLAGLAADLVPEQVDAVKDKLTIGKLPFTFNAYHDIVPNLTAADDAFILKELKAARDECLDAKNINEEGSAVFEQHKKVIEKYLNEHGHDWKASFKAFTDKQKAAKQGAPN